MQLFDDNPTTTETFTIAAFPGETFRVSPVDVGDRAVLLEILTAGGHWMICGTPSRDELAEKRGISPALNAKESAAASAALELASAHDRKLVLQDDGDGIWSDAEEDHWYRFENGGMVEVVCCGTCGKWVSEDWETADDEYQEIVCKACREAKAAAI